MLVSFLSIIFVRQSNLILKTGISFPLVASSILTAILCFVSLLIHELAHALRAINIGISVKRINLVFLKQAIDLEELPRSPKEEFTVAMAGPLINLIIAIILYGVMIISAKFVPGLYQQHLILLTLFYLAIANTLIASFNFLPGFPMDGGRMLRSAIWTINKNKMKATEIVIWTGRIAAIFIVMTILLRIPNLATIIFMIVVVPLIFYAGPAELRLLQTRGKLELAKVSDFMKTTTQDYLESWQTEHLKVAIYCEANDSLWSAWQTMRQKKVGRIFVKQRGQLVGSISIVQIYKV
ncbi:MAG: hypothetical protein KAS12_05805 [Candidatus Aenigmarchaeota archaeon]|nr:hypothetical protein [Candidatus Aenigmarchaeota archaeon]